MAAIKQDSMDLNTSEKLVHNLNLLAMHTENLKFIESSVDIEPILLVYFQKMAFSKQSKDVLSKVAR